MNNRLIIINSIRFIVLIILQVLVLNNVQYSGYINPYLYILFILMLPVHTPGWVTLITSFVLGIVIDMFSNTLGLHATACVFIGFVRPGIINLLSPKEAFETNAYPSIKYFSLKWFLSYSVSLVLMHHFIIFFLEMFSFRNVLHTLISILASSAATLLLIIITQYIFYKPAR